MASHSSIPAWEISWTEEPDGLQSMGSQRVGHYWATNTFTNTADWTIIDKRYLLRPQTTFPTPSSHASFCLPGCGPAVGCGYDSCTLWATCLEAYSVCPKLSQFSRWTCWWQSWARDFLLWLSRQRHGTYWKDPGFCKVSARWGKFKLWSSPLEFVCFLYAIYRGSAPAFREVGSSSVWHSRHKCGLTAKYSFGCYF